MAGTWEFLAVLDTAVDRAALTRAQSAAVRELGGYPPGCAACGHDGTYFAVYRDPDGNAVALSARCAGLRRLTAHTTALKALPGARVLRAERAARAAKAAVAHTAWLAADPTRADLESWLDDKAVMRSLGEMAGDLKGDETDGTARGAQYAARKAASRDGWVATMATALALNGCLTENQEASLRRTRAQEESDLQAAADLAANPPPPVPEGPGLQVTGRVAAVKTTDGFHGRPTVKALIEDDRGWRVWGTVPAELLRACPDGLKDTRVTLTATLARSGDDPTFGFYSRPRNGSVIPNR